MGGSPGLTVVVEVSAGVAGPMPGVAAWYLACPDGRVALAIGEAVARVPGARHHIESWYRLNAVVRGRPFGVLPAAEVLQAAPYLTGHALAGVP